MGKEATGEAWTEAVNAFLEKLKGKIRIESAIVHGSAAGGRSGYWSDVDLLLVSDDFLYLPFLERLRLLTELKVNKVEALGYSYRGMMKKGNPVALGALIEGVAVVESERVKKLREEARKTYFRKGRAWFPHPS
ncbi:MAG: nucleotidyltransferase domain-containing protein [Candidatus Bathyarchaeia archaeon]